MWTKFNIKAVKVQANHPVRLERMIKDMKQAIVL